MAATVFASVARLLVGDLDQARTLIAEAAREDDRTASRILVLDGIALWLLVAGKDEAGGICEAVGRS